MSDSEPPDDFGNRSTSHPSTPVWQDHLAEHAADSNNNRGKRFICGYCEYTTSRSDHMKRHVRRLHTGEKPFKCEYCESYCTADKSHLDRHIKRIHYREKPFKCELCDFCASIQCDLSRHTKNVHLKKKPHICMFCDYSAISKFHLTRHVKIHNTEKLFKCNSCEFSGTAKGDLSRHFKRVHSVESEPMCDYSSNDKGNISNHIEFETHSKDTVFQCEYCGYSCTSEQDISAHVAETHSRRHPPAINLPDLVSVTDQLPQPLTQSPQDTSQTSGLLIENRCSTLKPVPVCNVPETVSDTQHPAVIVIGRSCY